MSLRLALLAALSALTSACNGMPNYPEGDQFIIESPVMGAQRALTVHLPLDYEATPTVHYPVLIVLDAPDMARAVAGEAAILADSGMIPPVIVIGVENAPWPARNRDFTPPFLAQSLDDSVASPGEGDRFLQFLRDDVLGWTDSTYRTNGRRILVGWSRGALFSAWSLIADPNLFEARIALSPAFWREDSAIANVFDSFFTVHSELGSRLYMALGEEENPKMTGGFEHTLSVFERSAPAGLSWVGEIIPDTDHQSMVWRGTAGALRAVLGTPMDVTPRDTTM
jgi:predicted alpha/beta superfamily hydrolase